MKTLFLIATLTLTVHAQSLVDASGLEWRYIASGHDSDGAKFNVFARRVVGRQYPALEVKFGKDETVRAEHDCKAKTYRLKDGKWAKPKRGSVGESLVKFACGK